jgi:hypothetical protein
MVGAGKRLKPVASRPRKSRRLPCRLYCPGTDFGAGRRYNDHSKGHGSGEGRGALPGEVHDTALKAAETEATKRALATFGKPFGLALYGAGKPPSIQQEMPIPSTKAEPIQRFGFHPDDDVDRLSIFRKFLHSRELENQMSKQRGAKEVITVGPIHSNGAETNRPIQLLRVHFCGLQTLTIKFLNDLAVTKQTCGAKQHKFCYCWVR